MKRYDDWFRCTVGDIGRVVTGRTPSSSEDGAFGNEYPFITPSDMDGRRKMEVTARYLSEKGAALISSSKVPARSVAVSCIGSQMGKSVITTRTSFTNQQLNTIIPNARVVPEFLYYVLSTRQPELKNLGSGGTATPILNKSRFEALPLEIPPLPIQSRLVDILSTYDDLIENNTRRIKILEEVARSIYREWFVRFRFPGHEKTNFTVSSLGKTPADWRIDRLDSALMLQRGFDLPSDQRRPGPIPIYAATGIVGFHDEARATGIGVVTGRSGSLGTVNLILEDYWPLNTTLWIKEFKYVGPCFAYFLLSHLELRGLDGGAAVPTLNRNDVHALNMVFPPQSLIARFEAFAEPLFRQQGVIQRACTALRAQRDLLLPRLISGELDVSSLPFPADPTP